MPKRSKSGKLKFALLIFTYHLKLDTTLGTPTIHHLITELNPIAEQFWLDEIQTATLFTSEKQFQYGHRRQSGHLAHIDFLAYGKPSKVPYTFR